MKAMYIRVGCLCFILDEIFLINTGDINVLEFTLCKKLQDFPILTQDN